MNEYLSPLCNSLETLRSKLIEAYTPIVSVTPQLLSQSVSEMHDRLEGKISSETLSIMLNSFPSPFINRLNDITVNENYVDVPNDLCSAIEMSLYKGHVNISPVNDKKSRFSLEFFLSCVLPNIIALWGVLLTIYYHNIDNNKSTEKIITDEYTQALEEAFTSAISNLSERLQINLPVSPDIPLASPSCLSENPSSQVSDNPVPLDTHEFDNPDTHQSPEQ